MSYLDTNEKFVRRTLLGLLLTTALGGALATLLHNLQPAPQTMDLIVPPLATAMMAAIFVYYWRDPRRYRIAVWTSVGTSFVCIALPAWYYTLMASASTLRLVDTLPPIATLLAPLITVAVILVSSRAMLYVVIACWLTVAVPIVGYLLLNPEELTSPRGIDLVVTLGPVAVVVILFAPFQRGVASWATLQIQERERDHLKLRQVESERRSYQVSLAEKELELIHAGRLAATGQMMSSIIHELRQPGSAALTFVQAGLFLAAADPQDKDKLMHALRSAERELMRANDIMKRLRDFVTRRTLELANADLNDVVGDALLLVRGELRRANVIVHDDLHHQPIAVVVDRVLLTQVLMNLMRNAIEAVSDRAPSERSIWISTRPGVDGRATIGIRDSGPGIPADRLERLFEPFFTTKAEGLGLGLSICRAIVESLGGTVSASNSPIGGAVFHIHLNAGTSIADQASATTP